MVVALTVGFGWNQVVAQAPQAPQTRSATRVVDPVVDPPAAPPRSLPTPKRTPAPDPAPDPALAGRLTAAGVPLRVRVPRLHVDSRVLPIGMQGSSLVPPGDPQVLGWWQEGASVGAARGTALLTGHTVHTGGGALDHLDRLRRGDRVVVTTPDGWIRYQVRRSLVISTDELARRAPDLFDQERAGRLVLVTCDRWNGVEYLANAVVVAEPVATGSTG